MFTLIKNIKTVGSDSPNPKDLLLSGERIVAVKKPGQIKIEGLEVMTIDGNGMTAVPGLIDPHVHILGGGGEGGPATRAPELRLEDSLSSGVTTVIGCLGTDSVTRHPSSLLAKARALEIEGLSTWIYTGAYNLPTPTLTGSVRSDIALIDKVIGAGEIALSDHRSSQPTFEEFLRLVAECRVGGMLGGKAGVAHFHLGDGRRGLDYFFRMLEESELPVTQVVATHLNRNHHLFAQALEWLRRGGSIDLTCGPEPSNPDEVSLEEALGQIKSLGLPLTRVMASSDANGSLPVFDKQGRLVALTVASQKDFLRSFREVVRKKILLLEEAVAVFSTNAADFYKLPGKGKIFEGCEADLLLLDDSLELKYVFSRGRMMIEDGQLKVYSTFVL